MVGSCLNPLIDRHLDAVVDPLPHSAWLVLSLMVAASPRTDGQPLSSRKLASDYSESPVEDRNAAGDGREGGGMPYRVSGTDEPIPVMQAERL